MVNYKFFCHISVSYFSLTLLNKCLCCLIEINENSMTFLLTYLYVYNLIFLPVIMHMHIKLMNKLGNWLIGTNQKNAGTV